VLEDYCWDVSEIREHHLIWRIEGPMRLIKVVQFGFGLAVAGGTAVVVSGNALAADSAESPSTQTTQVVQETTQSSTDSTFVTEQTFSSSEPVEAKAPPSTATTDPDVTSDKPKQGQGGAGDDNQPVVKTSETEPASNMKREDEPFGASKDDIAIISTTRVNEVEPLTPDTSPALVYHSSVLPIQPTITSHTEPGNDLAASMPSAPVAENTPVPPKSSGALSKLGMVLAGTIVPQPFAPQVAGIGWAAPVMVILMLLAGLAVLFVSSYGAWLRRGGFATAARSDVPAPSSPSSFATPLLLSYVSAPPRQHSSLFGVANWFLTLSERRNCI
jgi:hypothetical protein